MSSLLHRFPRIRALFTRAGSLLVLFQRAPLIKMLFPEAQFLTSSGLNQVTAWTVTTIAGLGAYDTVAGATTVSQILPTPVTNPVQAAVGSNLTLVVQLTGTPYIPGSWTIDSGSLPPGVTNSNSAGKTTDTLSGTPTTAGTYHFTVTARDAANPNGFNSGKALSVVVGPAIITTQPASTTIAPGATTTLSVTGSGTGLSYQWFTGTSPSTTSPVSGATSATFTTPALNATTSYWVRVTRSGIVANSTTATVTVNSATAPLITTQPVAATIANGASTTLTVAASGTSPTFQWYTGNAGDTTQPVSGATSATLTTGPLTATTSFWARATNSAGSADSNAAVVTVNPADPFAAWKSNVFSAQQLADATISGDDADPDHDGLTNRQEYLLGTSPLTADTGMLAATRPVSDVSLSFVAKAATGPGYDGETRHYALQSSDSLATDAWTPVTGFEDITGTGQTVTFTTPPSAAHAFYRLAVTLTP